MQRKVEAIAGTVVGDMSPSMHLKLCASIEKIRESPDVMCIWQPWKEKSDVKAQRGAGDARGDSQSRSSQIQRPRTAVGIVTLGVSRRPVAKTSSRGFYPREDVHNTAAGGPKDLMTRRFIQHSPFAPQTVS